MIFGKRKKLKTKCIPRMILDLISGLHKPLKCELLDFPR